LSYEGVSLEGIIYQTSQITLFRISSNIMVTVAVAGGTGKVGRTIVEAIVAAGEHKVVILSREVSFIRKVYGLN
jgi:FlaA1/EpsC-like NDP-sugar epimerase